MMVSLVFWGSQPDEDEQWIQGLIDAAEKQQIEVKVTYRDVLEDSQDAIARQVVVTPTLDRISPQPEKRILGLPDQPSVVLDVVIETTTSRDPAASQAGEDPR